MKPLIFFLSLLVSGLSEAKPAPNFQFNGSRIANKLSDLKGHVVYLDFWASWCGPCRQSFPWMNEMTNKYKEQGLVVLAINLDNHRAKADSFLQHMPADFAVDYDPDGNIALEYDLKGMPSSFIIDQDGELISSHQGFSPKTKTQIESEIVDLLTKLNTHTSN
jgi:thiol-disulfide isomerase/thioredoxin